MLNSVQISIYYRINTFKGGVYENETELSKVCLWPKAQNHRFLEKLGGDKMSTADSGW